MIAEDACYQKKQKKWSGRSSPLTSCLLLWNVANWFRNNVTFTKAIWRLLSILSTWERCDPDQDLTLEFSAYSPSDPHHYFQDNPGLQTSYPNLDPISIQRDYIIRYKQDVSSGESQLNDAFHGFSAGQYTSSTAIPHLSRARNIAERLIRPLEFDFSGIPANERRLPEVKMISTFTTRRQFYRDLCPHTFGKLLQEALTGL